MSMENFSSPLSSSHHVIRMGPFLIDLEGRNTLLNNKPVPIPPCTFDYLVTLIRHAPDPVPYQVLVAESQGEELPRLDAQDLARYRVHMLRKVLEPDLIRPRYVIAVDGVGYRLEIEERASFSRQ